MVSNKLPIVNYQRTQLAKLLNVTEKLYTNHVFEAYLTPQQLIVLEYILNIADLPTKQKIWNELMNANLELNVVTTNHEENKEEGENNYKTATDFNEMKGEPEAERIKGEELIDGYNEDGTETDLNQLDLDDLRLHISDPHFIGNLSLKIRYVLWQCAIDVIYREPVEYDTIDENNDSNEYDYVLLEDSTDSNTDDILAADNKTIDGHLPATGNKSDENEEDDDYDDDDDYDAKEEENEECDSKKKDQHDKTHISMRFNDDMKLVLTLHISKNTLSELRSNNLEAIMKNWSKIYHSFENDKETLLKRLKLEENNELLESSKDNKRKRDDLDDEPIKQQDNDVDATYVKETDTKDSENHSIDEHDGKRPKRDSVSLPVNLGIANLSLKHLLNSIQANKSKLKISDYKLKSLITEVRKNRSKWTSDDKIGQEELYEACEKVALELRNYTEHSTPFLNKVSKREAPNYYLIIKKPMDLNTILKKLKTFQYESKQEFVDDIMLIWKNCLTYNSDPSHFLRAHAIAMQKKSLQLIPMIPNITVRDRAEVEKELAEMERDKEYEDGGEDEEEVAGSGRKGLNMGAHKPVGPDEKDEISAKDSNSGENILNETTNNLENNTDMKAQQSSDLQTTNEALNEPPSKIDKNDEDKNGNIENINKINNEDPTHLMDNKGTCETDELAKEKREDNRKELRQGSEDEAEEDEDDNVGDSQAYFVERDDDRDDIEISIWKSSTAKVRAEICLKRKNYFEGGRINISSEALLKNPQKMKTFGDNFNEYKEQKEMEIYQQKIEQDSIMKNGFGTSIKEEEEDNTLNESTNLLPENPLADKAYNELDYDNATLLQEYDSANGVPEINYYGVDSRLLDRQENNYIDRLVESGEMMESAYIKNRKKGMSPKMNANIKLIQNIRHICYKISLIRMLQNPQYLQNSKNLSNPNYIIDHKFHSNEIDDSIDIDPISQLNTHDNKNNRELVWRMMHKTVSKISMANGFETAQPSAANMLTEITGDYLSNLIKTMKLHQESNTLNTRSSTEILTLTLLENGIHRPDSLYSYVESEFGKKTKKLSDIKNKLEAFLKDLLRPTLQELSERNFEDESENFVTGNFASELTGEDFFGFKELGLEKEFGVLSNSVPLQLLTSQFQATDSEKKVQVNKIQPEEVNGITYSKMTKELLDSKAYLNTLLPLLSKAYEKSKAYSLKPHKGSTPESQSSKKSPSSELYVILESDEIITKKGATKLRLPPTGKISTLYKKKPITGAFFLPEYDEESKSVEEKEQSNKEEQNKDQVTLPIVPSIDEKTSSKKSPNNSLLLGTPTADTSNDGELNSMNPAESLNSSFSLAFPKIDQ